MKLTKNHKVLEDNTQVRLKFVPRGLVLSREHYTTMEPDGYIKQFDHHFKKYLFHFYNFLQARLSYGVVSHCLQELWVPEGNLVPMDLPKYRDVRDEEDDWIPPSNIVGGE